MVFFRGSLYHTVTQWKIVTQEKITRKNLFQALAIIELFKDNLKLSYKNSALIKEKQAEEKKQ
ncbi:hypothetical protein LCGC14_2435940, partial [marine sediment metagenome]